MDIIQGLIDTGNAGKSGWRIVNNGGAIGVLNNRTSNVQFSIINEGIGTSSNVPSSFINSYSGINVSNYTGTGSVSGSGTGSGSTGSLWSSNVSGSKIYYNSGNIGIGATDPIAPLHIYNTSNARLLLDATTTGTATVEFRRGAGADALNDYRFINDTNSALKLQVENTTQSFGNTIADLAWFSSNDTIIHKNTTFNGRVGIGTVYHTTRSLDVFGDANVSGTVSVGGLSISSVSGSSGSNAVLTNSITSNTSFTIHNGLLPPLPNVISAVPLASEIVVAGTTSGIIGGDRVIMFPYSGTAATKDYSITTTENLICDILVVGGGGGGAHNHGGGGGGGAIVFINSVVLNNGSYTIKVGAGGAKGTRSTTNFGGLKGNDTVITLNGIDILKAEGGGGGGQGSTTGSIGNGGSGGGGDGYRDALSVFNNGVVGTGSIKNYNGTTGVLYGNNGGSSYLATSGSFLNIAGAGGGGGGAGQIGSNATKVNVAGNGGNGISSAIINGNTYNFVDLFGTTYGTNDDNNNTTRYFGGGGGGGTWAATLGDAPAGDIGGGTISGSGGKGGGGGGALLSTTTGFAATANTGGGGGGGSYGNTDSSVDGGAGGSGIVIIRYRKPPADIINETISGIVGTADRYTIFPYTGTGTTKDYSFTTTEGLSCDILMIGGGGGGGVESAGGGGAGACIVAINQSINIGNYTIRVGSGGIGGILSSTGTITQQSTNGGNSSILNNSGVEIYRAVGGGKAGGYESSRAQAEYIGKTGGCGGGAGFWQGNSGVSGGAVSSLNIVNGVSGITPSVSTTYGVYGNVGGNSVYWNNSYVNGNTGGGGGIGVAGTAGITNRSGAGGDGLAQVSINSTAYNFKTYFAPDWSGFGVVSGGLFYIGGGGGGGGYTTNTANQTRISGGLGGGGIGDFSPGNSIFTDAPTNGTANTGSGGGGACGDGTSTAGGAGGSGLIIVRYRKLPNEIVVAGTTSTIVGSADRCISFPYTSDSAGLTGQTQYTFTTTEALSCDILVVGGGGGGAKTDGGGGGAGGLLYIQNTSLNGNYTVSVGKGGLGGASVNQIGLVGNKGNNSSFIGTNANYIAYGGGGGGYGLPSKVEPSNLGPYGSSGGLGTGDQTRESFNINTSGQGYLGGLGTASQGGGGGGGSGDVGVNSGNGGIGTQINITGSNLYYAGGGGGGHNPNGTSGGLGGGGSATFYIGNNATYYGGGGGGGGANAGDGGNGFEGIVIIRYRLPSTSSSSSINFIRGTTTDTNHDYKLGNFNGEFKVISSVFASASNIDTDYIRITTAGAITNPAGTANWNIGSDRRIKENIERASYDKCFENINRLELNRFNYVSGFNTVNRDKTQLGFIAQEVYDVFPKSISTQGYYSDVISIPDLMSIDISQINYALYGAVKKLIEINDEKDSSFKAMDEELKELEITLNITPEAVASSNLLVDTF